MVRTIELSQAENPVEMDDSWRKLICAGRAAEGLRAEWRRQLEDIQKNIGFLYIRFHGIFHDDMMVCRKGSDGEIYYSFHYIDDLIDFLLSIGLKPFIELGFMPEPLASDDVTIFWWEGRVSPPSSLAAWTDLVRNFVLHCIQRYGKDEVDSWYFEVWNEPSIIGEFWSGTREEYFDLYNATSRELKNISSTLKVGGPSSAFFTDGKAPWMVEFLDYVKAERVPLDFVSVHPYPVWWEVGEFSEEAKIYYRDQNATADDLRSLKISLIEKGFPELEIHVTEWNSSFLCRDQIHDTAFKAPFLIQNILAVRGLTDSLGYWAFTDIFEEHGAGESLFHGGFGLMLQNGLKKPAYYGYWFLSRLGKLIIGEGPDYLVVKNNDRIQILTWNYVHYKMDFINRAGTSLEEPYDAFQEGADKFFKLDLRQFDGVASIRKISISREQNSVYDIWQQLGSPEYPDEIVKDFLNRISGPFVEAQDPGNDFYTWKLKPHGISLVEIGF